jgi:hypothetical protein
MLLTLKYFSHSAPSEQNIIFFEHQEDKNESTIQSAGLASPSFPHSFSGKRTLIPMEVPSVDFGKAALEGVP